MNLCTTKHIMKPFRKRLTLCAILAVLACLTLVGCGNDPVDDGQNPEHEIDQVVKIGLLSIDDSLPFYVAEQEGLFAEAGVRVELVTFGSALEKETALEAGEIDGDMTDLVVTGLLKKGGLDISILETALGAVPSEGRFVLLASPASGITSIEQLKNQPIAIGNNTIIEYICDQICYINGFTKEEITTQNIPDLVLRLETLLSEGVQAAILPDPLASAAIEAGAVPIVDDTSIMADGAPVNLSQSVVIFRNASLEAKGETIEKFMGAYQEAKNRINADPESYRDDLLNFTSIPTSLIDSYRMPGYTAGALPTADEVNKVMDWMLEKGLLAESYSYEDFVQ